MSSKENRKNLLKQARIIQNLIKMQALINDSLTKINSLIRKTEDKKQVMLLAQINVNLLKIQRKLRQIENFLEKTTPRNSSGRNP
jgi:hypothetical protein